MAEAAVGRDAQPRDAPAAGLDDVKPLFLGVEPDLVGEGEPVGHDAQALVVDQGDIAVVDLRADRLHPVLDARRDRDPDAVLRIAQHEIDLADRLAVDAVIEHARLARARHDLEHVGAEIRDQDVAVLREGEAVRQGALGEARDIVARAFEGGAALLGDDLLAAVGLDVDDAAARVGGPETPVALGQDAFRSLQIAADIADRGAARP